MQMLSYRGPSAAGGVSNTLTHIFAKECSSMDWWYFSGNDLRKKSTRQELSIQSMNETMRQSHYRYCNNFLWPVLHDLPQFAHYCEIERQYFRSFNASTAARIRESTAAQDNWFINDYQFTLVPKFLQPGSSSFVFWHVPWPKYVYEEHIPQMAELAISLLSAQAIGFHTREYLDNFFNFVRANLKQFTVHPASDSISLHRGMRARAHITKFIVAPLGIDASAWREMSKNQAHFNNPSGVPYVLSVDRCDYTKGIRERLYAIEEFFQHHPQWLSNISFVQIGTKSREGLPEFDRYWQDCRQHAKAINSRWAIDKWQPLIWIENPMRGAELATLYAHAELMVVSPLRDGLNLTAKEFAACQHSKPGALLLSPSAGVWTELKEGCVELHPTDRVSFANSIASALHMSETEKYRRSYWLRSRLETNTLADWWAYFKKFAKSAADTAIESKVCG